MSKEAIHILLFKHFLSETSAEEEEKIRSFKKVNPEEYIKLKKIWEYKGQIDIQDFDTVKAWGKINSQAKIDSDSVIPLRRKIMWLAACCVIGLIGKFSADFFLLNEENDYQEIYISKTNTTDEPLEIRLSDSSIIWLNKSATLSFPEVFKGDYRRVDLVGEAFFDIKKNPDLPFIISTEQSDIKVLGTSFNVDATDDRTEVMVKTGKIQVTSGYSGESVGIVEGEGAVVNPNQLTSFLIEDKNFLSWKNGEFEFVETPISNVVKSLNEYYDDLIILKKSSFDCLLTTKFNQLSLSDVMDIVQLSCDLRIKQIKNYYEIY